MINIGTNIYYPKLDTFLFVYEDKCFDLNTIQNIARMHQIIEFTEAIKYCYKHCDSLLPKNEIKKLFNTALVIPHKTSVIYQTKD